MPDRFSKCHRRTAGLGAALALAAGLSTAAPPSAAPAADPADARAAVPPLRHQSAFSTYRRATDTPVGAWRDLNEAAARAGGWRAYAREAGSGNAAAPAAAASAPASAPPATPASGAAQHRHHGGHRP